MTFKYKKFGFYGLLVALAFIAVAFTATAANKGNEAVSIEGFSKDGLAMFSVPEAYDRVASLDPTRFRCGQIIFDRDGYQYGTVQIGNQCWTKQNLRTVTGQDGQLLTTGADNSERDCMSENNTRGTEADCRTRGALYTIYAATKGDDPIQGICPTGWHVPADSEFATLEQYLTKGSCNPNRTLRAPGSICGAVEPIDDCHDAGSRLKEGGDTGFNWQLSGMRLLGPGSIVLFSGVGEEGYLFSRTTGTCGQPNPLWGFSQARSVSAESSGIVRNGISVGSWLDGNFAAAPIRCIKN